MAFTPKNWVLTDPISTTELNRIETGIDDVTDDLAAHDVGSKTHTQIDTHIADKTDPHEVTPAQIGAATTGHTHTTLGALALSDNFAVNGAEARFNGVGGKGGDSGIYLRNASNTKFAQLWIENGILYYAYDGGTSRAVQTP